MPEQTGLSKRARVVFDALKACGPGWHSRKDIAQHMGGTTLSSYDARVLESLAEKGQVDAAREKIEGPIREKWVYRITKEGTSEK